MLRLLCHAMFLSWQDVSLQDAVKAKCAVLFSQARRVERRSVFQEPE